MERKEEEKVVSNSRGFKFIYAPLFFKSIKDILILVIKFVIKLTQFLYEYTK